MYFLFFMLAMRKWALCPKNFCQKQDCLFKSSHKTKRVHTHKGFSYICCIAIVTGANKSMFIFLKCFGCGNMLLQ